MLSSTATSSNKTTDLSEPPGKLPHARFEAWANRFPKAIAVIGDSSTLTYAELEQRANQIAHALRAAGAGRGNVVGIFLERGPDVVCALLGVLKSGAAFAILDPRVPQNALVRILASVDCPFLLTRRALLQGLPKISAQCLLLDDHAQFARQPTSRPVLSADSDDPACVLFTSGSTGHPKAVLYLHQNLSVRFSNTIQVGEFKQSSICAQSSPVTSIDAIDEIFLPLLSGGCTAILPYDIVTNPHQLIDSLSVQRVTHMLLVPSLLRVILSTEESLDRKLGALKTWLIGGEPLTAALTKQFYEKLPKAVLINFYGLTEGDATYHVTSPLIEYDRSVPIGHPVQGTQVYLLDENLGPVPAGETGEIYLAGEALSHEYVSCPELNAERWVTNPFVSDGSYARLFRTGDLGRLRQDGEIEYMGRADRMVKVRGFRVELGEVETILSQHEAVDQCIVLAKQPATDDGTLLQHHTYIIAYAVLKSGELTTPQNLRDFLKDRLPDQAVPAMVLILDSFPLSPNGKIDVHLLSKPNSMERMICKNYAPPRTPAELKLTRVWENLLKQNPIGIHDNFFEIGGDSLAAIDLMLTIEKEFQRSLPITVLFQSPTIAALAELLHNEVKSVFMASLVPIRVQGSRPPLFCIHADGSVFIYRRFANHLDADIPIFGLQAHGLANPQHEPYRHVDEMAAHYIREIQTVQPHGPYYMCAFSAGGLIIFEMARQLRAMGEEVAFLGLLDAYGPDYPKALPNKSLVDYKISVHLNTLRLHGMKGQMSYLWGRLRHRADLISSRLFAGLLLRMRLPMPRKVRYEYIARLIDRAAQTYPSGRTYPGEAVLFHALTQPEGVKPDPALGWANLITGDLKIVDVTGTHNSIMMYEAHVADLVRMIDHHLQHLHSRFCPECPSDDHLPLDSGNNASRRVG
jgi:amino acid adenylation domain-containing protein